MDGRNFPRKVGEDTAIEKGPVVFQHWTPLLLCSSAGFYGSVSVFFSSNVLVLLNGGHLIPF